MITIPFELNPERLSLAHEPESAAIYCQCLKKINLAKFARVDKVVYDSYMIVDVGGGTVDLSVYRKESVPDEHLKILLPPTGNTYGGALINERFMHFLAELVDDRGFLRYIATSNEVVNSKHKAELQRLRNDYFEEQKKLFGKKRTTDNDSRRLSVKLPTSFLAIYEGELSSMVTEHASNSQLADGNLRITYKKMEEFFTPVVDGILQSIAEALECIDGCIDAMYLVGGFGGSHYLHDKIKARFGDGFKYVVPLMSDVAVVEGAVWHYKNPQVLHSRLADSTYGIRVSLPFDASKHAIEQKKNTDGKEICENLFSPIVVRGDTVNTCEVFKSTHYPESMGQKQMNIELYSSQQADVKYTTEQSVKKIGELIVPLPTSETSPEQYNDERQIDIFFDFTYSELQVLAFDHGTQKQVKCVLDFFSSC